MVNHSSRISIFSRSNGFLGAPQNSVSILPNRQFQDSRFAVERKVLITSKTSSRHREVEVRVVYRDNVSQHSTESWEVRHANWRARFVEVTEIVHVRRAMSAMYAKQKCPREVLDVFGCSP